MLNKKSLFHFVYAIALVGAVMSCIGILNEFLNILQLYNISIIGTIYVAYKAYLAPLFFYLSAFIVSAFAITLFCLQLFEKTKLDKKTVNILIAVACGVLLIMSFVFIFVLKKDTKLEYFNYLHYYTFRSGVMSFVANMGIIFACNWLEEKCKKKQEAEQTEDAE